MPRHTPPVGSTQLLTFSCQRRLPLLGSKRLRDAFTDHLGEARDFNGYELHAYVVMPEHVHLIVTLRRSLAAVLRSVKQPFASRVIRRWTELDAPALKQITTPTGQRHFWLRGGGHWKALEGLEACRLAARYLHENPVRRNLVASPTNWRWSSATWYENGKGRIQMDPWPL